MRTAQQVAERAIVMATLAFRSSLDITDHPRSVELANCLLGWLERHRLTAALGPTEREILAAPRGALNRTQMAEAVWSAEGACLLTWALGLGDPLPALEPADARPLVQSLRIVQNDVAQVIGQAVLRPAGDIERYCVEILLTLGELRMDRLSDSSAQTTLRGIEMGRLADLGLSASDESASRVRDFVDALTAEQKRSIAGIQFVRSIAACWLCGRRETYYST